MKETILALLPNLRRIFKGEKEPWAVIVSLTFQIKLLIKVQYY